MRRAAIIALATVVIGVVAGCGPSITVVNTTKIPVRAVVTTADGSAVVSPSPGESSAVDAAEGAYRVSVIADAVWTAYATTKRKVLNDMLAHSENLSGPQLLEVIQQLKQVAGMMAQFEQVGKNSSSCSGTVSSDADGAATISTSTSGALVVSCK